LLILVETALTALVLVIAGPLIVRHSDKCCSSGF
jgi:hypothetical protein